MSNDINTIAVQQLLPWSESEVATRLRDFTDDDLDKIIVATDNAAVVNRLARIERGRRTAAYERKVIPGVTFTGSEKNRRSEERTVAEWFDKQQPEKALKTVVAQGWKKLLSMARKAKKEKQRAEKRAEATSSVFTLHDGIFCASVADAADHLAAGSIDAIITDPPYPKQYIDTFTDLSLTASKVLRPGGVCVVMSGQLYLPEVIRRLTKHSAPGKCECVPRCGHLDYYWTAAYLTAGQSANVRTRDVTITWKPLIVLTNGPPEDIKWFTDRVISDQNEKEHHDWGQSISGMSRIVEAFTEPGDLVFDPFVGGGTTAVAALDLGRRFIGSDVKEEQCKLTTARIADSL